jgi:hypothetical protein
MARSFGDGGGGSVEQAPRYIKSQERYLNQLTGLLGQQLGQGVPAYPGQLTPGLSQFQQQAFGQMGGITPPTDYYNSVLGLADPGAASRMMGGAETALGGAMQPFDTDAFMQTLEPGRQLALRTFNQDVIPGIMERYIGSQGTSDSGAALRALAREGSNLSLGLSAQAMPYLFQGQENQLGRQMQGAGQLAGMSMLPGQQVGQAQGIEGNYLNQLLGMGGIERGVQAEQMQEPYQKWLSTQGYNNPWVQQFIGPALGAQAFDSFYEQGRASPWAALAGGGLGYLAGPALGMTGPVGALLGMSMESLF